MIDINSKLFQLKTDIENHFGFSIEVSECKTNNEFLEAIHSHVRWLEHRLIECKKMVDHYQRL